MPPVKPTSTTSMQPKAQPRAPDNVVPRPTPTQEENDLAAAGVHVETHEWDGTPLQNPHGTSPGVPEIPPGVASPTVTSLSPSTAVSGAVADIVMTVNGSGFMDGTVIVFDGHDEPTTFISNSKVSTGVKPSLFVVPATCPVGVRNGSVKSNEMPFTFT